MKKIIIFFLLLAGMAGYGQTQSRELIDVMTDVNDVISLYLDSLKADHLLRYNDQFQQRFIVAVRRSMGDTVMPSAGRRDSLIQVLADRDGAVLTNGAKAYYGSLVDKGENAIDPIIDSFPVSGGSIIVFDGAILFTDTSDVEHWFFSENNPDRRKPKDMLSFKGMFKDEFEDWLDKQKEKDTVKPAVDKRFETISLSENFYQGSDPQRIGPGEHHIGEDSMGNYVAITLNGSSNNSTDLGFRKSAEGMDGYADTFSVGVGYGRLKHLDSPCKGVKDTLDLAAFTVTNEKKGYNHMAIIMILQPIRVYEDCYSWRMEYLTRKGRKLKSYYKVWD